MVRIGVTGATGHMAREVIEAADERGDEVAFAVSESATRSGSRESESATRSGSREPESATRSGSSESETAAGSGSSTTVEGIPVEAAGALPDLLETEQPDALVDFTVPEASVRYLEACADAGVPAVVGTTGFGESELAALRDASERTAVLKAANFARGVHALLGAVREAVEPLPGYDIELTETHHNRKRDAPSGTARSILSEISDVRDGIERVHGREGVHPRRENAVGVHVRRAGDVRGEHEVMLAGNDEVLTIAHRAESRAVFAAGALDAAGWLAGREPGWYEFGAVLETGGSGNSGSDPSGSDPSGSDPSGSDPSGSDPSGSDRS